MAKAVVFDIGGVLIELNMERCIRGFREILGFERITELLDPYHQKGIYGDMEEGILSAEDFRSQILADSRPGCVPSDVDRAMKCLLDRVNPEAPALIARLKGRYPLYLLSNNNPISMPFCLQALRDAGVAPEETFAGQFISCEMKMLKPSAAFYREAVRRVGLPAGEIVFIDDNRANVDGALAVGLDARYYASGSSLVELLKDL